jgi:hypothetical protein
MRHKGNRIGRVAVTAIAMCIVAAAFPLPGSATPHRPLAGVAKKCKKRHRHHRKRRCKRPARAPAMISVSPASLDFGVPQIGGETRTLTVANVGGSPSGVPVPALSQTGDDFSIIANGCMGPLAAGAGCPVEVRLGTRGAGPVSATLTVTAIPGGTASAPLRGNIQA